MPKELKRLYKFFSDSKNISSILWSLILVFLLSLTTACGEFEANQQNEDLLSIPGPGPSPEPTPQPTPEPPPAVDTGTNGSGGGLGLFTKSYEGRDYRLYVPSSYDSSEATPIVVAFHGVGDYYTSFDQTFRYSGWQQVANQEGFIIMVPNHKNSQRASFLHFSNGQLDLSATSQEMVEVLETIYYGVGEQYNIDVHQIHWTGFSEGAVFANIAASVLSNEIHSVVLYAGAAGRISSQIERKMPLYFITGVLDYSFSEIQAVSEEWQNAGHTIKADWPGASHSFGTLSMAVPPAQVWDWLKNLNAPEVQDTYF